MPKKFLINFILLSVSLMATLMICEMLVRVFAPQQLIKMYQNVWIPYDGLGYKKNPNLNTVINTGDGDVHLLTNLRGERICAIESKRAKEDSDIRILTIGDSFLEAMAINNRDGMQEVLRRGLEKKMGLSVYVANTGVGGWGPLQYLSFAKMELEERKYDLGIVFLYVANDIDINKKITDHLPAKKPTIKPDIRFPKTLSKAEIVDALIYPINEYLEARFHLYILFRKGVDELLARIGITHLYFPKVFSKDFHDNKSWDISTEICSRIHNEFKNRGSDVIFVLIPAVYQIHPAIMEKYIEMFGINTDQVDMQQASRILKNKFDASSLKLFDMTEILKDAAKSGQSPYGIRDRHLNSFGHKVIGKHLIPIVKQIIASRKFEVAD